MTADPAKPRHTVADWLALHGVTAAQMQAFVAQVPMRLAGRDTAPEADPRSSHDLSPEAAWDLCVEALYTQLDPALHPAIADMATRTRLVVGHLPKGAPRALTLPDGGDGHPLVTCPFDGVARDLITLAHEMGHALQIVASAGATLPPILREACAFAAEEALLAHLHAADHPLAAPLAAAWQNETTRILARPLQTLNAALKDVATPYDYVWNYPPARGLSMDVTAGDDPGPVWLFAGQTTLSSLF